MQRTPSDAAQILKSRAEVQLLTVLNQNKAKSASGYLRVEQQRVEDEEQEQQQRQTAQNLKQFRIGAGKNAPPPSEADEMIAAVRQLEYHVIPSTPEMPEEELNKKTDPSPSQIELNAIRRRETHMEALRQYTESVKTISEDIEVAIIDKADIIKETLTSLDNELAKKAGELVDDALLLKCEHGDVLNMWAAIQATCERRRKAIEDFGEQLELIERSRVERVGAGLKVLTKTLMDTAHALPPEVERIIEAEAYEVNVVVISNRRAYADLITRMATRDVDVFVRSRLQWEDGQVRWRRLRHDDAIQKFHNTISSSAYTDPSERQTVMAQLRMFQKSIHDEKRVAALIKLKDAGADLTSQQVQLVLTDLIETQRHDEERNASYFVELTHLHDDKVREAQQLREALRLELHGFGSLAPEGDIASSREKLLALMSDESLEEFFRMAGGLRNELDSIAKKLDITELIYQANLAPLRVSVGVLLSALPLEAIMENQGKGAERKAVQATIDKMRKAAKHEIMGLVPALQTQVAMLLNLSDTSDIFKAEVEDVSVQLRLIMEDYEALSVDSEVGAPDSSGTVASPPNTQGTAQSLVSGTSPGKSLPSSSFGTSSSASLTSDSSSGPIDLQAIRKVQRRIGTLVYAAELSPAFQEHLAFIAEQLELQFHANDVVDQVITTSCDEHLAAREEESKLFLKRIGQKVEHQSQVLHDQCERLAKFFMRVAQKMEEGEDRVRFVNLSVMDLLDTLQDNDQEANAELESQYSSSCARLRHAPDSSVLQEEFEKSTDLLQQLEASYRLYQKRVTLAAQNHVVATHKQHENFLFQQCSLFALVAPTVCEPFNLEHFLSVQFIDDATLPKPPAADELLTSDQANVQSTGEASSQAASGQSHSSKAAATQNAAAAPKEKAHPPSKDRKAKGGVDESKEVVPPPKDRFKTASGLELDYELMIPELVQRILTERNVDDGEVVQADTTESEPPQESSATSPEIHPAGDDGVVEEETVEEIARREARDARLKQVEDQALRDFLALEIEDTLKHELLHRFRDAVMTKFDVSFKGHISSAAETQAQRLQQCNLLLEERLRMHWPRKGRLDVQIYQPRIGELYSHRQRHDRHIRSMTTKVQSLQTAFEKHVTALQNYLDDVRLKQLTLQAQLPMQQSLAALQGLEVKSKKLLSACRSESDEKLEKLRSMTTNDLGTLASLAQDYVRVCSSQIFPDLSSCEVISGCDFHPEEVAIVQSKIQSIEANLRLVFEGRDTPLSQLVETQRAVLEAGQEFKNSAQERYRSETTRADELSAKIDEQLASLQSVVENKQTVKMTRLPDDDVATQILHLLLRLRAKLFYRGKYFDLLKNTSQLEPLPVNYDAGGVPNRPTTTDRDTVDEDYLKPPELQFLDFVKQVATKCREDTRQLYQQEGKLDELPASGVPAALEEYLTSLSEKARAYVLQQELKYREQVDLFGELLALAPDVALHDHLSRSREGVSRATIATHEDLQHLCHQWMEQKNRNMVDLRPDLCSPNNALQLQALWNREAQRSDTTLAGLRSCRLQIFNKMAQSSSDFEKELIALCKAFATILDTSVMTLEDLKPFGGEELPKLKRKTLKRLRKLVRIEEFGDPREVKRTEEEMKKLSQLNEVPRFPRRGWPAIPSFGSHVRWETKRAELARDDEEMGATTDSPLAEVSVAQAVDTDGACTALLTHAHRCLIHSRDEVYAAYEAFSSSHSQKLFADLQERLRDEIKWTESWRLGIDKLRHQKRSSSAAPAETHATN